MSSPTGYAARSPASIDIQWKRKVSIIRYQLSYGDGYLIWIGWAIRICIVVISILSVVVESKCSLFYAIQGLPFFFP